MNNKYTVPFVRIKTIESVDIVLREGVRIEWTFGYIKADSCHGSDGSEQTFPTAAQQAPITLGSEP